MNYNLKFFKFNLMIIFSLLFILGLVIFPKESIEAARKGLDLSLFVVLPSLFPFFVCSSILINSDFVAKFSKYFSFIMKPLFNLPGSSAISFVLGIMSGYPVGAKSACELYKNNYLTKNEAQRLISFCNNSGPLFILGTVGSIMYKNSIIGVMLLSVHILASICVGIIFRFFYKDEVLSKKNYITKNPSQNFGTLFSNAIADGVNTILIISGYIVFFSVLIAFLNSFKIDETIILILKPFLKNQIHNNDVIKGVLYGFFELTTGTKKISEGVFTPFNLKIIVSGIIIGFGGLSVHSQVMGILASHKLSIKPYIIGKALHGAFSGIFLCITQKAFPIAENVFLNNAPIFVYDEKMNILKIAVISILHLLLSIFLLAFIVYISRLFKGCNE